jgi:hypothetical protein
MEMLRYPPLQLLHDKTLQISRFRHAGKDGVVGALASLLNQPDVSLGLARCRRRLPMKLGDPCYAPLNRSCGLWSARSGLSF